MRLQAKFGRRALATAAVLVFGTPATGAHAARMLEPSQTLHPTLVGNHAPPLSAHSAPNVLALRVPDRQSYTAVKTAAEQRYRAWLARHPQGPAVAAPAPSSPLMPSLPAPRAGTIESFNQLGLIGDEEENTTDTPPDPTGTIGPGYYIEFVNSKLAIYPRANLKTPLKTEGEDSFTKSTSTCDGQIRWDQQAGRWEYASLDCGAEPFGFSFGWSKNADPTNLTTGWCKFHESTGKVLYDYPKLGGDNEYLLFGANKYELSPAEKYLGSDLLVIPKPVNGIEECPLVAPTATEFSVPVFTPVPVNIFGSSTSGYAVASDYPEEPTFTSSHLRLFTVTKPLTAPVVSESSISIPSYTFPAGVPQPGTTDELDSSDTRITQAVATEYPLASHELDIWTQHTVAATLGGPSYVQWFELKPGSSTTVQSGKVEAGGGNFAFNGAISPTAAGSGAVIDYNVGGPEMLVQLRAQSRISGVSAGTTSGTITLAKSSAVDNDFSCPSVTEKEAPCRWGDYAGASPDPTNPEVVWGSGQFDGPLPAEPHAAQWRTENFALTADTPPVASFKTSTSTPSPGEAVSFDGSASHDSDGTVVSYEWDFGDESLPQIGAPATTPHTYTAPGKYVVALTVTDDKGLKAKTERAITVDAPPTVSFIVGSASPIATMPIGFDGSTSTDTDGSIANYAWSFGDGGTANGVTPAHTYATSGQYSVTLTVTDNAGKTASVTRVVSVADAAPTAALSVLSPSPAAGMPVGFDGSGSKDADGSVATYDWSFGDGTSGSGPTPSHLYTKAGTYAVKLTVTDNGGVSASTEQTITVAPEPNVFAVVAVKPNKRNGSVTLSVHVPGPGVFTAADAASTTGKATLLTRLARIFGFTDPTAGAAKKGDSKHKPRRRPALVKLVRVAVSGLETTTAQIVLTAAGKAELGRHHHKLAVKLLLTFAPTYGSPASKTQVVQVSIVKPKGKKKRK